MNQYYFSRLNGNLPITYFIKLSSGTSVVLLANKKTRLANKSSRVFVSSIYILNRHQIYIMWVNYELRQLLVVDTKDKRTMSSVVQTYIFLLSLRNILSIEKVSNRQKRGFFHRNNHFKKNYQIAYAPLFCFFKKFPLTNNCTQENFGFFFSSSSQVCLLLKYIHSYKSSEFI